MKIRCVVPALFVVLLASTSTLLATTYPYDSASFSQLYPISKAPYNENYYRYNGPTYFATSGGDSSNGSSLSYFGVAQASKGFLRSESHFSCTGCPPASGFWGIGMQADWIEGGAKPYTVGSPDILAGIVAYKVTWNLHGSLSEFDSPYIYGEMIANTNQFGVTKSSNAQYFAPPLGPDSFYLQPNDLTAPFDFSFQLFTLAGTGPGGTTSGDSNFGNTAIFLSLAAIDAEGNIIPGVSLQLSDGTLMGTSGFEPAPPTIPEPSSGSLIVSGLLFLVSYNRRVLLVSVRKD